MQVEARHSRLPLGQEKEHQLPAVEASSAPLGFCDGSPVAPYPPHSSDRPRQPLHLQQGQPPLSQQLPRPSGPFSNFRYPQTIQPKSNPYTRQLIEPASMPSGEDLGVDSLELEDSTTMTGGTSWTLRVPWLRGRRSRRQQQRLEDETNSIQSTSVNSKLAKVTDGFIPPPNVAEEAPMYYYGGLMKTTAADNDNNDVHNNIDAAYNHENDPHTIGSVESSLSGGAGSLSILGAVANVEAARVLQQQRQPQRQMQTAQQQEQPPQKHRIPRKYKKRRLLDDRRKSSKSRALEEAPSQQINPDYPSHTRFVLSGDDQQQQKHNSHPNGLSQRAEHNNTKGFFRNRSWLSYSSKGSSRRGRRRRAEDEDSLADFDDTEWTPQDSAYGAAIPVCGWIPKKLRQVIEATMIALIVFLLVYIVVKTSITVSESKAGRDYARKHSNSSKTVSTYDNKLQVDDDWYVEYSQYNADDDDYFQDNNNRDDDDDVDAGNGNR